MCVCVCVCVCRHMYQLAREVCVWVECVSSVYVWVCVWNVVCICVGVEYACVWSVCVTQMVIFRTTLKSM